jgi:hypothetical protein
VISIHSRNTSVVRDGNPPQNLRSKSRESNRADIYAVKQANNLMENGTSWKTRSTVESGSSYCLRGRTLPQAALVCRSRLTPNHIIPLPRQIIVGANWSSSSISGLPQGPRKDLGYKYNTLYFSILTISASYWRGLVDRHPRRFTSGVNDLLDGLS